MAMLFRCLSLILMAFAASCGGGQDGVGSTAVIPRGEFRVNTTTIGDQLLPVIAGLLDGGFVVSWTSDSGVFMQRFDSSGAVNGSEMQLDSSTSYVPSGITGLSDGGFVVTWESSTSIYAQRFDATGAQVGEETLVTLVNIPNNNYQNNSPSVKSLNDGGYLVTWERNFLDISMAAVIYAQRFDSRGAKVGTEIQLTPFGGPLMTDVTGLSDGYVVTWTAFAETWLHSQRFTSAGEKIGSETLVDTSGSDPDVIGLNDGGYVVTWASQDGDDWDIWAQRFDGTGARVGGETLVNTTTVGDQEQPAITALSNGGYVVTWLSQDGDSWGIWAQRFDSTGARVGGETLVNTTTVGDQGQPAITALSNGGYVVTWVSNGQDGSGFGIYAQQFDAQGQRL